jgi:hypothetical protein
MSDPNDPDAPSPAISRIVDASGAPSLLDVLAEELPGTDLTTLLLEVQRRRAALLDPADVMRRYASSRFTPPASTPLPALRLVESACLAAVPDDVDILTLSPVVPFGAHAATAGVRQDRVLSTVRGVEVAADPTLGLALEATVRRRALLAEDARSMAQVGLATIQRIVRGQRFEGPAAPSHFELFGLAFAARDTGNLVFERESASVAVRFAANALLGAGIARVRIELTDFSGTMERVVDAARAAIDGIPSAEAVDRPDRTQARGYYPAFCFKVIAAMGSDWLEVGDGGFVDWTQRLVPSAKERLLILGLGVDRIAMALHA